MVNLADITRQSGHGAGLDAMSRMWGLDPAHTARAVEALLPAFTLAFQRLALNPVAFAEFSRAIGSGAYASFFDNPGQPQATVRGAELVHQLFRSPEAAHQVANQAAALTGVGVQVMREIMPTVAATLAGGAFRFASVEGFAELLRQWGDALKAASERLDPPKPPDPWSVWQTAASRMMGLPAAVAPPVPPAPAPPSVDVPNVLDAWAAMVGGMAGSASAPSPRPLGRPDPCEAQETAAQGAGDDLVAHASAAPQDEARRASSSPENLNPFEGLSQMFETGREAQEQHLAAFRSILDSVWGSAKP